MLSLEEWLSAADAAFDKVFSAYSTSHLFSPSQLLTQMLKVFTDSKICVNERRCGVIKGFLLEYIAQRSVSSDDALASVSIQPDSGTQVNVSLTQLCIEESEVLFVYQPVAEDTADAIILVIGQEGVTMVEDPYSESAAQHKRYLLLFVCHNTGGCTISTTQVSFCLYTCYSYPAAAQTSNKVTTAALHGSMP